MSKPRCPMYGKKKYVVRDRNAENTGALIGGATGAATRLLGTGSSAGRGVTGSGTGK